MASTHQQISPSALINFLLTIYFIRTVPFTIHIVSVNTPVQHSPCAHNFYIIVFEFIISLGGCRVTVLSTSFLQLFNTNSTVPAYLMNSNSGCGLFFFLESVLWTCQVWQLNMKQLPLHTFKWKQKSLIMKFVSLTHQSPWPLHQIPHYSRNALCLLQLHKPLRANKHKPIEKFSSISKEAKS